MLVTSMVGFFTNWSLYGPLVARSPKRHMSRRIWYTPGSWSNRFISSSCHEEALSGRLLEHKSSVLPELEAAQTDCKEHVIETLFILLLNDPLIPLVV